MITDPQFSEEKYNIKLNELFTTYIINLLVTFISVFVIIYFIMKAMPTSLNEFMISNSIGIIFTTYIMIVSIITIIVFRKVKQTSKDILIISCLALVLSFINLVFYVTKLVGKN
jgi:hypothetical protein